MKRQPLPSLAGLIFTGFLASGLGDPFALYRDGSRTAATSKMERFVIIVNGWKPLTILTNHSILDVTAVLDPSLLYD